MKTLKAWLKEPDPPQPPVSATMIKRVLLINMVCWVFILIAAFIERNGALLALAVIPFGPAAGLYFDILEHGIRKTQPVAPRKDAQPVEDGGQGDH